MTTAAARPPEASRGSRRADERGQGRDGRVGAAGQQRGRRAVGHDGEPVGQRRAEHGQALQPVPGELDPGVLVPAGQQGAAEREHLERHAGHGAGADRQPAPEPDGARGQHRDQRPAQVAEVLGQLTLVARRLGRAARGVEEHVRGRDDEPGQVVLEEVGGERAAVLVQRAEELHPQRVAGQHGQHAGRDAQAAGQGLDPARHVPGPAGGHDGQQQRRGQPRAEQDLLADEQLRGDQEAQSQTPAPGRGTARRPGAAPRPRSAAGTPRTAGRSGRWPSAPGPGRTRRRPRRAPRRARSPASAAARRTWPWPTRRSRR